MHRKIIICDLVVFHASDQCTKQYLLILFFQLLNQFLVP
eukprot:UN10367